MFGLTSRELRKAWWRHRALPMTALLAAALASSAWAEPAAVPLDASLQPAGTVSFQLRTERAWQNGAGVKKETIKLLGLPDFGQVVLQKTASSVSFGWQWLGDAAKTAPNFRPQVPELPGPETYYFQFTWDADAGRCDFYVNGMAMRDPAVALEPWQLAKRPLEIKVFEGPFTISHLEAKSGYLTPAAARAEVPAELLDRRAEVFGLQKPPPPMAVDSRLGRVLLETKLASADDVRGWVMEGPGQVAFRNGWMQMRSTRPDAAKDENGHVVFWCPRDFPASFVAEWDVQILKDFGLTIFFFAAKGEHGEDVFDPSLPKRDGTFAHYIHGAVNSYHISYYASTPNYPGRASANLRKNNKFYLISNGAVAIDAGDKQVHHVRLIKDGAHIQFQTDGRVVIDYTDPGTRRYGPVYGDGKMAFRQMQWTVARYRNFGVTELLPKDDAK